MTSRTARQPSVEKLSYAMRLALERIAEAQAKLDDPSRFAVPRPSIRIPTLEALERRGLVELQYDFLSMARRRSRPASVSRARTAREF